MKRVINFLFILFVCFVPSMVNAKVDLEFKKEITNLFYFGEKNGNYLFFNENIEPSTIGSIVVYDKNFNVLKDDSFLASNTEFSLEAMISSKYFKNYYNIYGTDYGFLYDEENGKLFTVQYDRNQFGYENSNGDHIVYNFNDDLSYTKKLLGKMYDVYNKASDFGITIENIYDYNGFYGVIYCDSNFNYSLSIYDSNLNIIKTYTNEELDNIFSLYVYDNMIYEMVSNRTINILKANGELYDTVTIDHEILNEQDGTLCGDYYVQKIYVENGLLYIMYNSSDCRIANYDLFDFTKKGRARQMTLIYSLDYNINKVEPKFGDFTYTSKVDEEGREYVELNIKPDEGYSVENIIVTDVNGNRIDVTNNKFYVPLSDVDIEVKFIKGQYIQIPNTFLRVNPIIIIIGLLLVSYGVYLVYFNSKIKNNN